MAPNLSNVTRTERKKSVLAELARLSKITQDLTDTVDSLPDDVLTRVEKRATEWASILEVTLKRSKPHSEKGHSV